MKEKVFFKETLHEKYKYICTSMIIQNILMIILNDVTKNPLKNNYEKSKFLIEMHIYLSMLKIYFQEIIHITWELTKGYEDVLGTYWL
jgi:hypothetical protein